MARKFWWHRENRRIREFPGGKVEPGETHEAALVREIQEELVIQVKVVKRLGSHPVVTPTQKQIQLSLFAAQALSRDFTLNDHDSARWISWKDLKSVKFLPGNMQFLPAVEAFFTQSKK